MALRVLPLLTAAALAGCLASPEPGGPPAPTLPGPGPATRLLVLGDTGTGAEPQFQVARAALQVCELRGCDAAIVLGDNIYENGVGSVTDPQFDAKFEEPYAAFDIPFYLVLGNHDNGGQGLGTETARGDFQVQYTQRADRASAKWTMPARYYDVRVGPVHLFGIDSTALYWEGDLLGQRDPLGRAQQAWLEAALEASDAPWKFVLSHHPRVSNGQHGDAGQEGWVEGAATPAGLSLKRFFEEAVCGRAHFLLAGHDHDLQWLAPTPACATEHIVSGAGAKTRPLADPGRHEAYFQRGETLGFWWMEVAEGRVTAAAYDGDGTRLFERGHAAPGPPAGLSRGVPAVSGSPLKTP